MFPHFHSAVPQSQKLAYVTNEYQPMTSKCSAQSDKRKCHMTRLCDGEYADEFVNLAISRKNSTAQNVSNDQIFFKIPYIDGRIKSIIKKAHQQIIITCRGHTIRTFLSKNTMNNCPRDCRTEKYQSRYVVIRIYLQM